LFFFNGEKNLDFGYPKNIIEGTAKPLTVEALFQRKNGANGHIVNFGGGWDASGFSLFMYEGCTRIELQDKSRGEKCVVDNPIPNVGSWTHIAFTWDNNSGHILVYINGKIQNHDGTFKGPIGNPTQKLMIGTNEINGFPFFGFIKYVRIWNIVRTELEINQNMAKTVDEDKEHLLEQWILKEDKEKKEEKENPATTPSMTDDDLKRRAACLVGPIMGTKASPRLREKATKILSLDLPFDDSQSGEKWLERLYIARGMKGLCSENSYQLIPILFQLLSDTHDEVRKEAGKTLTALISAAEEVVENTTNAPFMTNLIVNPCAQNRFEGWTLMNGGDGWALQTHGFVTSFAWCDKNQTIDLLARGFTPEQLDLQPPILIQDWVWADQWGDKEYRMHVHLLNNEKAIIDKFSLAKRFPMIRMTAYPWELVTHVFQNYGTGVRYIFFIHGGKDTIFWKGHYGAAIRDTTVVILKK